MVPGSIPGVRTFVSSPTELMRDADNKYSLKDVASLV
jgi:hypothetical protein